MMPQAVREEPLEHPLRWPPNHFDAPLVERSIEFVLTKIDQNLAAFGDRFPAPSSVAGVYAAIDNVEWTNGFWTGMLWLAYEVTGDRHYLNAAQAHVVSFEQRVESRAHVDHHDLGFLYTLSCVSAYKLTGSDTAKDAALMAAELLLHRYLPAAGIIQAWGDLSDPSQRGRMIIDCNLNLPLLYWASEITGEARFREAANTHIARAAAHIVRSDASTFHTFCMDAETGKPLYGKTHQGHSDDSCWARGQAWGMAGFALVYRYNGDVRLVTLAKKLANYFLNRLPDDGICYWDLHFTSGPEPRDSSAAAIAACGLLELERSLPLFDPHRSMYQGAAWAMVRQLSQTYLTSDAPGANGVLKHAVYHMPNRVGVDESCVWGDYFYFEALVRLSRVWRCYW